MEILLIALSILLIYPLTCQIITAVSNAFSRPKKRRTTKPIKKPSSLKERENRLTTFQVSNEYQKKFYDGDPEYYRFVKNIDDYFKSP